MNPKPFGYAIVDKDGKWVEDLRTFTGLECGYYDEIRIFSAPHRLVEVYIKQQFEPILRGLLRGDCFCEMAVGNPMCKSHDSGCKAATDFLHSIVESSTGEQDEVLPEKGNV